MRIFSIIKVEKFKGVITFNCRISEIGFADPHIIDPQKQAEDAAQTYPPNHSEPASLCAQNAVQLEKLNEAEVKYKECLALNSADKSALDELEYINIIRSKNKL